MRSILQSLAAFVQHWKDENKLKRGVYGMLRKWFKVTAKNTGMISGDSVGAGAIFISPILHVDDTSIPGDTTGFYLLRFEELLKKGYRAIALHLGGNDLRNGVPVGQIVDNLRKITNLAALYKARIGWMEPPVLGHYFAGQDQTDLNFSLIPALIDAVASANFIEIIKWRAKTAADSGFIKIEYLGDGIHPNQRMYADVWVPILEKWF